MRLKSLAALLSFIILAAGTGCPLLRPFGLLRWNVFDLNKPYGLVLLLASVTGIVTVVFNQMGKAKIIARVGLVLVLLLYIAALLKVHSTFSFIPFKGMTGFLTRQIKFLWGWLILGAGAVLSVVTTSGYKKSTF